jgi:hypothetical protein
MENLGTFWKIRNVRKIGNLLLKNKEYTENREHILENLRKFTVPKSPLPPKKSTKNQDSAKRFK